jgi:ribonuclease E
VGLKDSRTSSLVTNFETDVAKDDKRKIDKRGSKRERRVVFSVSPVFPQEDRRKREKRGRQRERGERGEREERKEREEREERESEETQPPN